MAITTRNYIVGNFESTGAIPLTDVGSGLNFFELDAYGFKFALADVQFWEDAGMTTEIGSGNYSLTELTDYTEKEAGTGGSGKTVYGKYQITNGTYQTGTIYVSGNSFGTFTDNDLLYELFSEPLKNMAFGKYDHLDLDNPLLSAYTLPDNVVEANGQLISDADSPYNGYRIRNVNGADVTLTLTWASGVATVAAADLPALNVGDWVSGGAIASEAQIADITGTTVTLTDTAISDTDLSTTFNNDGMYLSGGAASGVSLRDQMQGHWHQGVGGGSDSGTSEYIDRASDIVSPAPTLAVQDPITDGTNGDPRTGTRTRPHTLQMVAVTRIK